MLGLGNSFEERDLSDYKLKSGTFIFFFLFVQGIILFKEKAKEALEKARSANNGNLQLRNKKVTWKVLEGHAEKDAMKKIMDDQQESLNKWKSKGGHYLIFYYNWLFYLIFA